MEFSTPVISALVLALIIYFALARPQRKREDRYALMVAALKPGCKAYAGGGGKTSAPTPTTCAPQGPPPVSNPSWEEIYYATCGNLWPHGYDL